MTYDCDHQFVQCGVICNVLVTTCEYNQFVFLVIFLWDLSKMQHQKFRNMIWVLSFAIYRFNQIYMTRASTIKHVNVQNTVVDNKH